MMLCAAGWNATGKKGRKVEEKDDNGEEVEKRSGVNASLQSWGSRCVKPLMLVLLEECWEEHWGTLVGTSHMA